MPKPIIHYNKVKNPKVLDAVIELCPVNVFEKKKGKVVVARPEDCIGCKACESHCENGEINVVD